MSQSNSNYKCAICDSDRVEIFEIKKVYRAPFGPNVEYISKIAHCLDCGETIDITDPLAFPKAVAEANEKSIESILDYLTKQKKCTLAEIERSFELPDRILSNWKCKEKINSSGLALLRLIRAYPWTIKVADENFDESAILKYMRQAFVDSQKEFHGQSLGTTSYRVMSASSSAAISYTSLSKTPSNGIYPYNMQDSESPLGSFSKTITKIESATSARMMA